jgi:hypothetical protein
MQFAAWTHSAPCAKQDTPRFRQERATGWREANDAVRTLQDPHAKDAVQSLDLAAGWRLRRVQSLGGAAEMRLLGGGDEATELTELEQRCTS